MERFLRFFGGGQPSDSNQVDMSETVYISTLALLKMLEHGRSGSLIPVRGLMIGKFVDAYTVDVTDVIAMDKYGAGVPGVVLDPNLQMVDLVVRATVFWSKPFFFESKTKERPLYSREYHPKPGSGCWLSAEDVDTQRSYEAIYKRAVAVVFDPIQSVKGKVVIDAFRTIKPQATASKQDQETRQTPSNLGHEQKPSIQDLKHGLNKHYYSIPVAYKYNELEQKFITAARMDEKTPKMNKWDGLTAKNTLDDAIRKVLNDRSGWTEIHSLMNWRLIISFIAVAFSGLAIFYDYKFPFPEIKIVLAVGSLSYFFVQLYQWYIKRNVFYQAYEFVNDNQKRTWTWRSDLPSYDKYTITAGYTSDGRSEKGSITKNVANFINEDGEVMREKLNSEVISFYQRLANKDD